MVLKPSQVRAQLGTAAFTALVTVLVVGILFLAANLPEGKAFEYLASIPKTSFISNLGGSPSNPDVRYLITFGDSYTRTQFPWDLAGPGSDVNPTAEKPLGATGNTSSGGLNWAGYMATEFNTTTTLLWNFGYSACIIDQRTLSRAKIDLREEMRRFNVTIGHRPDYAPWTSENAVAAFWLGQVDFSYSWRYTNLTTAVPDFVERLIGQGQFLYDLGLRNILFLEVPALELVPMFLESKTIQGNPRPNMGRYWVYLFNYHLRRQVDAFRIKNPDAKTSLIPTGHVFWDAFMHPQSYGVQNTTCTNKDGVSCLWYNRFHPGTRIHEEVAKLAAEAAWGYDATKRI